MGQQAWLAPPTPRKAVMELRMSRREGGEVLVQGRMPLPTREARSEALRSLLYSDR